MLVVSALYSLSALIAGATSVSALAKRAPFYGSSIQKPLGGRFQCDLPPALDPAGDGLLSASDLFSSKAALTQQVKRHQAIVRVPSVSYDDLGEIGEDERWAPFHDLHAVLERTYPIV